MYVIRYNDLKKAVDPQRKLVKLSAHHLWKAPSPEGSADWEPGREIRSDALGVSLFTTGTDEILHYHERTWEIYQVLEGQLKIAVKPYRLAPWEVISMAVHDLVILTPGTMHLVDSTCLHVTQVIQSPPSLTDKVVIHQQDEIDAVKAMLQDHF